MKAGVGGQRGRGVHTDWVRDKWAKGEEAGLDAMGDSSVEKAKPSEEADKEQREVRESTGSLSNTTNRTMSQASTDSSCKFLGLHPFILL